MKRGDRKKGSDEVSLEGVEKALYLLVLFECDINITHTSLSKRRFITVGNLGSPGMVLASYMARSGTHTVC
jgi:hypothetical protein